MGAAAPQHDFIDKHEEILERRATLLEQMESHRDQLQVQRKQQLKEVEAAHHRNHTLLQDLHKIEERLRGKQLPHPNVLALETRYWASVEESVPAWEHFLLGKGPHPTDNPVQPPRRAKNQGLPPRMPPALNPVLLDRMIMIPSTLFMH